MNTFVKLALDATVKPEVEAQIAALKANKAANIAIIEADIAKGEKTAVEAVAHFVMSTVKASPSIQNAVNTEVIPVVESALGNALGAFEAAELPTLYDEGVAFLEKIDSEI